MRPVCAGADLEQDAMLLEGEVNWTLIFAVLALAGFLLAAYASFVALRNGRRGRHVSSSLDHARQTAASTDKRLLEVLNAVPVALVQTDTQGRFIFANRAAHQLLGRRDAGLLGLRFHAATWGISFPDGRPIAPEMLPTARALRGQMVKGFQHLIANPSTRRRMLVSVTAMPIEDDRGQITGCIAAIVETESLTTPEVNPTPVAPAQNTSATDSPSTDSPDALSQMVPLHRIDGGSDEPGALATGLAQDFGGLLTVINSALDMAVDPATPPAKVRRLAQAALGAGRRGEVLVRRMAGLSAGQALLTPQDLSSGRLDLAVLVRAAEARLSARAGDGVDLMVSAPTEPVSLTVDPVALEAALTALVVNAAEAGARSVAVRLEIDERHAVLSVRDDGSGMKPETARRAAEAFFTTRPGAAGLGLGQAVAFVRSVGGTLAVDSVQGQGTEVRLVLPRKPAPGVPTA